MESRIPANFRDLWSSNRELQNQAYGDVLEATNTPVDWAYVVWDEVLANLSHKDNHNRSIAAQLLSNLAKSDPEDRLLTDFGALFAVTKDERFVTARHCLQSLWKIGAAGPKHQALLVDALENHFRECIAEKNGTLIRYDIIEVMRKLYDQVRDESLKAKALAWIETEEDLKYRKKYAGLWKAK